MTVYLESTPTLEDIRTWPPTVPVGRAAGPIGISPSWLYQLIAEGNEPCKVLRLGPGRSRVRILTSSLVSLLETGEP